MSADDHSFDECALDQWATDGGNNIDEVEVLQIVDDSSGVPEADA